jgi:hypothetical protein
MQRRGTLQTHRNRQVGIARQRGGHGVCHQKPVRVQKNSLVSLHENIVQQAQKARPKQGLPAGQMEMPVTLGVALTGDGFYEIQIQAGVLRIVRAGKTVGAGTVAAGGQFDAEIGHQTASTAWFMATARHIRSGAAVNGRARPRNSSARPEI